MGAKQPVAAQNGATDKSADNSASADTFPYKDFLDQAESIAHSAWESKQKDETMAKLSEKNEVLDAQLQHYKEKVDVLSEKLRSVQDKYLGEFSQHMRYNAQKGLIKGVFENKAELSKAEFKAISSEVQALAQVKFDKEKAAVMDEQKADIQNDADQQATLDEAVKDIREKYKKKRSATSPARPLASAIAKKPVGKSKAPVAKKKPNEDDEPKVKNAYQNWCAAHMEEYKEERQAALDAGQEFTMTWPKWAGPKWEQVSPEEREKWKTPPNEAEAAEAAKTSKAAAATSRPKGGKAAVKPAAKPAPKPPAPKKAAKPRVEEDDEEEKPKKKAKKPLTLLKKPSCPPPEEEEEEEEEQDPFAGTDLEAGEVEGKEVQEEDKAEEVEEEDEEEEEEDEAAEREADDDKEEEKERQARLDKTRVDRLALKKAGESIKKAQAAKEAKPLAEASQKEMEELHPSDDEKDNKEDDACSRSSDE